MNLQTTPVVVAFVATLAVGMILHATNRDKLCLIPFCAVIVAAIAICIPRFGFILNLPVLYRYEGDIYARTGDAVIWGFFRIPHEQAYDGWVIMMVTGIMCTVVAVWLIGRANTCRQAEKLAA